VLQGVQAATLQRTLGWKEMGGWHGGGCSSSGRLGNKRCWHQGWGTYAIFMCDPMSCKALLWLEMEGASVHDLLGKRMPVLPTFVFW